MGEELVGTVSHYYGKPGVAAVKLTDGRLMVGDTIHIVGHTSDVTVEVASLQIEHESVDEAGPGDHVGVGIGGKARSGDRVFRVSAD